MQLRSLWNFHFYKGICIIFIDPTLRRCAYTHTCIYILRIAGFYYFGFIKIFFSWLTECCQTYTHVYTCICTCNMDYRVLKKILSIIYELKIFLQKIWPFLKQTYIIWYHTGTNYKHVCITFSLPSALLLT